jgi:hypothetical protein
VSRDQYRAAWRNQSSAATRHDCLEVQQDPLEARSRKLELLAKVNNALQSKAYQTLVTLTYNSPQFAQPSNWIEPRNMNLIAKFTF